MAMSKTESVDALSSLPKGIRARLVEGKHRGKCQLYATHRQKGNAYRLVVCDASMQALNPVAGEVWTMHPDYTPNGHVVFCSISHKFEEAETNSTPMTEESLMAALDVVSLRIENAALIELQGALTVLVGKHVPEPTREDYRELMTVKDKLKRLPEKAVLSSNDEKVRRHLIVTAYKHLNVFEDYYEARGHK